MKPHHKYPSSEKLKSKKDIDLLFKKGKSITAFPIRVVYRKKEKSIASVTNTGVSVSKKNIKLAVNRNLIKRRIRESYRLNCQLLKNKDTKFDLMFIYSSKEILPYVLIERKIKVLLTRLSELE